MNAPAHRPTGVSKIPLKQVKNVREMLMNDMAKQQLASVAAQHLRPERMMQLMGSALRTTPQLAECEPLSLLGSMMTCASLGVEPNTPLGHAYLIPFKNNRKGVTEVQLVIGYKGMIDLARRSGHIVNIHGDVVYEGDEFSFEYGSNQHLSHRPIGKRENPTHAYCHAKLTDGEAFVVWPYEHVLEIRNNSQGYKTAIKYGKKDSPWIAHEHEMAAKTMVRALFKYLPISIEMDGGKLSDAMTVDDQHVDFTQFAQHPDEGYTIDGEYEDDEGQGEEYDPETGEVTQIRDQRAEQSKVEPEPKKQTAQSNPQSRKAEKAPDHTDKTPQEERPKRQTKAKTADDDKQQSMFGGFSASEMLQKLDGLIKNDLQDGAPLDETLEMYAAQLSAIKKVEPDEYAAMIDDFKAFVAERDGQQEGNE